MKNKNTDLQKVLENLRENRHFRPQDGSKIEHDDPKIDPRAFLAALGAILARLEAILGPLRAILGRSWASEDDLGADLGRLGTILGRSWVAKSA